MNKVQYILISTQIETFEVLHWNGDAHSRVQYRRARHKPCSNIDNKHKHYWIVTLAFDRFVQRYLSITSSEPLVLEQPSKNDGDLFVSTGIFSI